MKIVKRGKIVTHVIQIHDESLSGTHVIQIHDGSLSGLATGTAIKKLWGPHLKVN